MSNAIESSEVIRPGSAFPEVFTRTCKDGTVLRFVRSVDIPNENFWQFYIGASKKSIGYLCLPMFSKRWSVELNLPGLDNRRIIEDDPEDVVLKLVKTIDVIMS